MVSEPIKRTRRNLHKQRVNDKFAIGFLSIFAVLVSIYTLANCRYLSLSFPEKVNSPAASVVQLPPDAKAAIKVGLRPFISEDEFKSFIDDGKRAYGDGVFEPKEASPASEKQLLAGGVDKAVKPIIKAAAKVQKEVTPDIIDVSDARNYISLGGNQAAGVRDIVQTSGENIYFSPENQFYSQTAAKNGLVLKSEDAGAGGQTMMIAAFPAESMGLSGTIESGGTLLLSDDTLLVFGNNSLAAYDTGATSSAALWQTRINEGTEVISSKIVSGDLYVAIKTKINDAYPCPMKPLALGEEPVMVNCKDIYHPEGAVLADYVFSVLKIDTRSGEILKKLSFVGEGASSAVLISPDSIYALWGQAGDYVSFFAEFLNERCKGLLPDYLLEKAAELPGYDISLAAKEVEMRGLIANWVDPLDAPEKKRVEDEVSARMADYLRGHYRDFEQTGLARADTGSFQFVAENVISGRIADSSFVSENDGSLRVITVSGSGTEKKLAWLMTGIFASSDPDKAVNNVYVMDSGLSLSGYRENLDLPAGICAIDYTGKTAFVSLCRPDGIFYTIDLSVAGEVGLRGQLIAPGSPSYLHSFSDVLALAASKNDRKIKLSLFDVSLAAAPELRSSYDLNDYWADFDGNYAAFAEDKPNRLFFLPSLKGGYIFSYRGGRIELKKTAGNFSVSRAVFLNGYLYLVTDEKIEVYGGPDWDKVKSLNL